MTDPTYCPNTVRLGSDNYKKTGKTYTEQLKDKEIFKLLEKYEEVEDINDVPLNTHVRYFAWDPKVGHMKFRVGGFLKRNDDPRYVVLSNSPYGGKTWSVQTNKGTSHETAFFRLKSTVERSIEGRVEESQELYQKCRLELKEKQKEIENLKSSTMVKVPKQIGKSFQKQFTQNGDKKPR